MSKFLDLIKSHLPEKEQKVVVKRTIPPRERPRPSKGANAPMEISKATANPVDDKVNSFVELLKAKGISAQKSKSKPDTVRIVTGNGNVLIKVIPEEDGEAGAILDQNKEIAQGTSPLSPQAKMAQKQNDANDPLVVKAATDLAKRTRDSLASLNQADRMGIK